MPNNHDTVPVAFRAPSKLLVQVDAYAAGAQLSRSSALRQLVEKGLGVEPRHED